MLPYPGGHRHHRNCDIVWHVYKMGILQTKMDYREMDIDVTARCHWGWIYGGHQGKYGLCPENTDRQC